MEDATARRGRRAKRHEPEEIERRCSEVEIKRESSISSYSIVVSERGYHEEPDADADKRREAP